MKKEIALSFLLSCTSLTALAGEKLSLKRAVKMYLHNFFERRKLDYLQGKKSHRLNKLSL